MSASGKIGNKGGGRKKVADAQIQRFKSVAWDLIVKRCTDKKRGEEWLDKYIPMFANKLMPQQIEGTGENGIIPLGIIQLPQKNGSSLEATGQTRNSSG